MTRILAYKAKVGILAYGTFGQGPNVGRNWLGRVRLEFSGRKMESRLKPGWSGRVFGRVSGRPEADLKGGSGGAAAPQEGSDDADDDDGGDALTIFLSGQAPSP